MIQVLMMTLGPLSTNSYIVGCEETRLAAVIDPAWSGSAIAATLDEQMWEISHILITHSHFDHVGGLAELKQATGAPIYMHRDALEMLQGASMLGSMTAGLKIPQPPLPDHFVREGDLIKVGNIVLEVLDTPGHAPGHVSFLARDHRVLFSGDVLFEGSIGRTDFPGSDHKTLMRSIREKLLTLPEDTRVFPGHGYPTTIGSERRHNPFLTE